MAAKRPISVLLIAAMVLISFAATAQAYGFSSGVECLSDCIRKCMEANLTVKENECHPACGYVCIDATNRNHANPSLAGVLTVKHKPTVHTNQNQANPSLAGVLTVKHKHTVHQNRKFSRPVARKD